MGLSDKFENVQIKQVCQPYPAKAKAARLCFVVGKSSQAFGQRSLPIPQWEMVPSVSLYLMESFKATEQRSLI